MVYAIGEFSGTRGDDFPFVIQNLDFAGGHVFGDVLLPRVSVSAPFLVAGSWAAENKSATPSLLVQGSEQYVLSSADAVWRLDSTDAQRHSVSATFRC